jgi:hypothetical protein
LNQASSLPGVSGTVLRIGWFNPQEDTSANADAMATVGSTPAPSTGGPALRATDQRPCESVYAPLPPLHKAPIDTEPALKPTMRSFGARWPGSRSSGLQMPSRAAIAEGATPARNSDPDDVQAWRIRQAGGRLKARKRSSPPTSSD